MTENRSSRSSTLMSKTLSESQTSSDSGKETIFWIKSEIFSFGLLPISSRSKISYETLLEVVKKYRYEHELNAKYFNTINSLYPTETKKENVMFSFKEWETIATENLDLNDTQIKFYFDRFLSLRDMHVGMSREIKDRENFESASINFYEFILYLYCQLFVKFSFYKRFSEDTKWTRISNELKDNVILNLENIKNHQTLYTQKLFESNYEFQLKQYIFVKEHMGFLLRLLSADDPQNIIRKRELKPLKFLFACGNNFYSTTNNSVIDFFPKSNKKKKYGRSELSEWIIDKLRINTYLYLDCNFEDESEIRNIQSAYPKKNILYRPLRIINVHNKTLLRTDPESLPKNDSYSQSEALKNKMDENVDMKYVKISNCSYCYIYLLYPIYFVNISSCSNCTIILGSVGGVVSVEDCKSVTLIAACHSIQIQNCISSTFNLLTNRRPILLGSNYNLQFGPYNTHYRSLLRHTEEARLVTSINYWNEPIIYVLDVLKHDTSPEVSCLTRSPLRTSPHRFERQTYSLIKADNFLPFRVPFELQGQTKQIPFELETDYQLALEEHSEEAINLKKTIEKISRDRKQQNKIQKIIKEKFENWLIETGGLQQIENLVSLQME